MQYPVQTATILLLFSIRTVVCSASSELQRSPSAPGGADHERPQPLPDLLHRSSSLPNDFQGPANQQRFERIRDSHQALRETRHWPSQDARRTFMHLTRAPTDVRVAVAKHLRASITPHLRDDALYIYRDHREVEEPLLRDLSARPAEESFARTRRSYTHKDMRELRAARVQDGFALRDAWRRAEERTRPVLRRLYQAPGLRRQAETLHKLKPLMHPRQQGTDERLISGMHARATAMKEEHSFYSQVRDIAQSARLRPAVDREERERLEDLRSQMTLRTLQSRLRTGRLTVADHREFDWMIVSRRYYGLDAPKRQLLQEYINSLPADRRRLFLDLRGRSIHPGAYNRT